MVNNLEERAVPAMRVAKSDVPILAESARFAIPSTQEFSEMSKTPSALESAIREVYDAQQSAVEPILTTKSRRNSFVEAVQQLVPGVTEDAVLQHLVRLRKRGVANGGLPRKSK